MNTSAKFFLGLLLSTFLVLAVLIPNHNEQHHSKALVQIVYQPEDSLTLNFLARAHLVAGDTLVSKILQRAAKGQVFVDIKNIQ